ncbi:MAG: sigma-70 family RNA polymerase sigma factor [Chloroflexota bacterium]|nr:sigma-70 family RNA polymerase sigma factor [Chloroflexota bacterium]
MAHTAGTTHPSMALQRAEDFERDARPAIEEQELLGRVRAGDELAFARLFERHWDAVCRILTRLLGDADAAGDLAQEVFVQLYRKPPANEDVPLGAWLYRVALNRGYNALRADRRRRTREELVAQDYGAESTTDGDLAAAANRAEERDAVRQALVRLPERQRDCLMLRAEGLSYAEIAVAVGVAPGSVGTLIARAERAFKGEYLARRGGM